MNSVLKFPSVEQEQLISVALLALSQIAKAEEVRDSSATGPHSCTLEVSGRVDDRPVSFQVTSDMLIRSDYERTSNVVEKLPDVLAVILGKLNESTRMAILRDLPEEYNLSGRKLNVTAAERDTAEGLLASLRNKKTQVCRGSVQTEHELKVLTLKDRKGAATQGA